MWGLASKLLMRAFSQRLQFRPAFFYHPNLAIGTMCGHSAESCKRAIENSKHIFNQNFPGTKEEHLNMLEGGIIAKLLDEKWTTYAKVSEKLHKLCPSRLDQVRL